MRLVGLRFRMFLAAGVLCGFFLAVVLGAYSVFAAVRLTTVLGNAGALAVVVAVTLGVMFAQYKVGVARIVATLHAGPLHADDYDYLHHAADVLSDDVGVARPTLVVAEMGEPNALALGGPRGGRVFLSKRLLTTLTPAEQRAILAHELVHLKHRDTVVQSLAHSVVRMIGGITWCLFAVLGVVAWLVGKLAGTERDRGDDRGVDLQQQAVAAATLLMVVLTVFTRMLSRQREYVADRKAVDATGDAGALVRALRKIEAHSDEDAVVHDVAPASLAVVGVADAMLGPLFDTHPQIDRRVERIADHVEG
jgi:heat shock protein HtpX